MPACAPCRAPAMGTWRDQHLRRQRLRGSRPVPRDPHQGYLALFDSPVPLQAWSQETYYTDRAQPGLSCSRTASSSASSPSVARSSTSSRSRSGGASASPTTTRRSRRCRACSRGSSARRHSGTSTSKMGTDEASVRADAAFVRSGMTSKEPVTLRDGTRRAPHRRLRGHAAPATRPRRRAREARGLGPDPRQGHPGGRRLRRREGRQAARDPVLGRRPRHQAGQRAGPGRHVRLVRHL